VDSAVRVVPVLLGHGQVGTGEAEEQPPGVHGLGPLRPNATGHYLPGLPQRTCDTPVGAQPPVTRHSADVFVDGEGLTYVTDYDGGLNILQYEGIGSVS
jgi:hypothetical protein